jgi:hypothetical protein
MARPLEEVQIMSSFAEPSIIPSSDTKITMVV